MTQIKYFENNKIVGHSSSDPQLPKQLQRLNVFSLFLSLHMLRLQRKEKIDLSLTHHFHHQNKRTQNGKNKETSKRSTEVIKVLEESYTLKFYFFNLKTLLYSQMNNTENSIKNPCSFDWRFEALKKNLTFKPRNKNLCTVIYLPLHVPPLRCLRKSSSSELGLENRDDTRRKKGTLFSLYIPYCLLL